MFANITFTVQYPNKIMKNRLNSDTSEESATMIFSPESATESDTSPIKLPSSSWVKVPYVATQNEYNRCGITVTRLADIKPFSTFKHVPFMFACPDS